MDVIVIELEPVGRVDRFRAKLPDGTFLLTSTKSPRHQGARKMLELGYPPETLITTRHQGKDYNNWNPETIGELAKWAISENDKRGLSKHRYRPFPGTPSGPSDDDNGV